jgi:hypothetical protein
MLIGENKMKILIGFLLALFISGQAYAQSSAEILGKGKVVSDGMIKNYTMRTMVVVYNNSVYQCIVEYWDEVYCKKIKDSGLWK